MTNFHLSFFTITDSKSVRLTSNSINHLENFPRRRRRRKKTMASTSAVTMSLLPTQTTQKKIPSSDAFLNPLLLPKIKPLKKTTAGKLQVKASSFTEKAVTGLTAAALTASMVMPDVAEAAELTPSLKNFLLSIAAGGVVLTAIVGAVIGVSNFDPVKRS